MRKTTLKYIDCDFVDFGGNEQSLSEENRSWKFCTPNFLPSAEVALFTQFCLFSLSYLYLFQKNFLQTKL